MRDTEYCHRCRTRRNDPEMPFEMLHREWLDFFGYKACSGAKGESSIYTRAIVDTFRVKLGLPEGFTWEQADKALEERDL